MRKKVVLACTECMSRNYTTEKNREETNRIEMKKFCKRCNLHTRHLETN